MKITIHHATPQHGHNTTTVDVSEARAAITFQPYDLVAVAGQLVRDFEALEQAISDLPDVDEHGVETEVEVYIVPQMMGG